MTVLGMRVAAREVVGAFVVSWFYALGLGLVFLLLMLARGGTQVMRESFSMWIGVLLPIDLFYGTLAAFGFLPFVFWVLKSRRNNAFRYLLISWIMLVLLLMTLSSRLCVDPSR